MRSETSVNSQMGSLNVLIGRDCSVSGKLSLAGSVQIDGEVEGDITASGELIVGETAVVEAKIAGTRVKIYGKLKGDISCSERLELLAGAEVSGNISSPSLIIEDGVTFEGYCSMQGSRTHEQHAPALSDGIDDETSFSDLPIGSETTS